MITILKLALYCMIAFVGAADAQSVALNGQASGWTMFSTASHSVMSGLRYIPEFTVEQPVSAAWTMEADLALNASATSGFARGVEPRYDASLKPYRAWLRAATDVFEARAGLQKLNFGSATLFRPLMWFDRLDPRDPLQLTSGVYGLLLKYTFPGNANIWMWGLAGNRDPKGWETVATAKGALEFGGRLQMPAGPGEAAVTFHHRRADWSPAQGSAASENRVGIDGKWDIGVGAWFEASLTQSRDALAARSYQRLGTVGFDYTFDIGDGLTVLTELFRADAPATPFGSASGVDINGWSLTYPLGVVDRISAIIYRDLTNRAWYRLLTWQRTYDSWIIYVIGFWNPDTIALGGLQSGGAQGAAAFAGAGAQIMVVFNH